MSVFWVLHDYGVEGWHVVERKDYPTVLDAVCAREADVANGGGRVVIVEVLDLFDAYRSAGYERRDQAARKAAQS